MLRTKMANERMAEDNSIKQERSKDAVARGKALRSYAWSSYPGYPSARVRKPFLRVELVLGYFGGDTAKGRRGYARYVEHGIVVELENPLTLGKGHGIIGERDFVEEVRLRYLSPEVDAREVPAVAKIQGRVEPERIVETVCAVEDRKIGDVRDKLTIM